MNPQARKGNVAAGLGLSGKNLPVSILGSVVL